MSDDEELPDHLRCKRSDGKQWRCRRRAMEGKKSCQLHSLQLRLRQHKEKVPESLKIKRRARNRVGKEELNPEINPIREDKGTTSRPPKRSRNVDVSEALDGALKKMKLREGDLQLELIRIFLKNKMERKKDGMRNTEFTRELPNGLMLISQPSSPNDFNDANVPCNEKLGFESGLHVRRYFRSKNIEPVPIASMQIFPYPRNGEKLIKVKRKKCHWCRKSNYRTLIKCCTCKKEYYCADCILERPSLLEEQVKKECPVCLRTCPCRVCLRNRSKDVGVMDNSRTGKENVRKLKLLYFLRMILPVLEQMNRDQMLELEVEANIKGVECSQLQIRQTKAGCSELYNCNHCKASILDIHRSCRKCSYKICLSCCSKFFKNAPKRKKLPMTNNTGSCPTQKFRSKRVNYDELSPKWESLNDDGSLICPPAELYENAPKRKKMSMTNNTGSYPTQKFRSKRVNYAELLPKWEPLNDDGSLICPPVTCGGCGDGLLDLQSIFPPNWTNELQINGENAISSYDDPPQTVDDDSSRKKVGGMRAARRENSADNFLYHPIMNEPRGEVFLSHFQKYWEKGHPVIVQKVFNNVANKRNWDPLVMFCSYLNKRSDDRAPTMSRDCLDWFEVEICSKNIFMGSTLEAQSYANLKCEMLKLKFRISSQMFQDHFPDHFDDIIDALPLQEYMNPESGILNLAANLPEHMGKPSLGPYLHISFGGPEDLMHPDFITKLCYDSHDMINILVHTTNVPITSGQMTEVKDLMKKYNSHQQKTANDEVEEKSSVLSEEEVTEESGSDVIRNELPLSNGVADVLHSKSIRSSTIAMNKPCIRGRDSGSYEEELKTDTCGAQWDIFRQQDVPKLLGYLKKHSKEFGYPYCVPDNNVVHPIFDKSFYLDTIHKIRLKEEFNIEPWTFEQHPGEAVIVPAGCPYQFRKLKSCVSVVLNFVSPENTGKCIKLIDEIRLLPVQHKARKKILEVKKMTLYGVSSAIKEID